MCAALCEIEQISEYSTRGEEHSRGFNELYEEAIVLRVAPSEQSCSWDTHADNEYAGEQEDQAREQSVS